MLCRLYQNCDSMAVVIILFAWPIQYIETSIPEYARVTQRSTVKTQDVIKCGMRLKRTLNTCLVDRIIIDRLIFSAVADSLYLKWFCWVCNFSRTQHKIAFCELGQDLHWAWTYTGIKSVQMWSILLVLSTTQDHLGTIKLCHNQMHISKPVS